MRLSFISAQGRVTIPVELRRQFGLKPGTRVTWLEEKGRLVLAPMTAPRIKAEKIMKRYRNTLRALAK